MKSISSVIFRKPVLSVAALLACAFPVLAQTNQTATGSTATQEGAGAAGQSAAEFLRHTAHNNDRDVAFAEVAARKAQSPELRAFAQQVQQDHLQANKDLRPLAQKYGVKLDQPLSKKNEKTLAHFQKLHGVKFDQKFATEVLIDHEREVARFETAATQVQEPDVKQYIQNQLPKLRQHLQHGADVARAVGVKQSTIAGILKRTPSSAGGTSGTQQGGQGTGSSSQPGTGKSY